MSYLGYPRAHLGFGPEDAKDLVFDRPRAINKFIHDAYGPRIAAGTEFFVLIPLDANKRVIQTNVIAEGEVGEVSFTINQLMAPMRPIQDKVESFVLAHNHPSGNPTPSQSDIDMTKAIIKWGRKKREEGWYVPEVEDHVITTARSTAFSSMKMNQPELWE